LLVTKAGTGLPTRGHHIDAFAVCLGFSPVAFVTKTIVARRAAIYNAPPQDNQDNANLRI
jgi:hypothetical protein